MVPRVSGSIFLGAGSRRATKEHKIHEAPQAPKASASWIPAVGAGPRACPVSGDGMRPVAQRVCREGHECPRYGQEARTSRAEKEKQLLSPTEEGFLGVAREFTPAWEVASSVRAGMDSLRYGWEVRVRVGMNAPATIKKPGQAGLRRESRPLARRRRAF